MPVRHQGLWWQDWDTCQRCGFIYPLSMLTTQKGLIVCTVTCLDNLDVEQRPVIIAETLSSGDEFTQDKDQLQTDTTMDDLEF